MEQEPQTADALNQLLQGEYMAVDTFNVFISKLEDESIKETFQQVQDNHRENIQTLAGYIQNIGGKPNENLGFKGRMADMKLSMELGENDDSQVVKKAVEGETNGINMAEKILRGKLDDKSRDLAGEVLKKDRSSLEGLKKLM